jgi:hypothetical protein
LRAFGDDVGQKHVRMGALSAINGQSSIQSGLLKRQLTDENDKARPFAG